MQNAMDSLFGCILSSYTNYFALVQPRGYHCGTMVQSMGSRPEKVPDPEYGRSMCVAVDPNPRDLCLHTQVCSFRQRHIHVYIMYECIYIYDMYIHYIYILCIWYIQRHVSGSEPRNKENACVPQLLVVLSDTITGKQSMLASHIENHFI